METAYSLKGLGEKLQKYGMPVALDGLELTAAAVYKATKEWLEESAAMTETKIDDVAVSFFPQVDLIVLPQIDKISPNIETK